MGPNPIGCSILGIILIIMAIIPFLICSRKYGICPICKNKLTMSLNGCTQNPFSSSIEECKRCGHKYKINFEGEICQQHLKL